MILDSNAILFANEAVTSEAIESEVVGLTSLLRPGLAEPVVLAAKVVEEAFEGGTSLTLAISQSDTEDGDFEDTGISVTTAVDDLTLGAPLGFRFLPRQVTKPWIKVTATPDGEFTAGKIFAAIVREDELPYGEGMYVGAQTVLANTVASDAATQAGEDLVGIFEDQLTA